MHYDRNIESDLGGENRKSGERMQNDARKCSWILSPLNDRDWEQIMREMLEGLAKEGDKRQKILINHQPIPKFTHSFDIQI